jgi:LacI family transcriptional regulator
VSELHQRGNGIASRRTGRPTIRDIAGLAGVSVATVSRVLNDRPDVAAETRGTVLRLIRDHNFTTNRTARGLSAGRTGLVGLTLPVVHADYFGRIASGAAEALYEQDMRVVLCPTLHEHEREVSLLEQLMDGTTDGAVVLLPSESSAELKELMENGYPFVVVDPRELLDEGIAAVSATHWSGARAATNHLLSLGHRRIAVITGPADWAASQERLNGYRAALRAAGITPSPELIAEADFLIDGGRRAATELLTQPHPPTAIFAFNDNMAVGVMQVAAERGLRIPRDLSIVGFDDSEQASIVTPPLTTVRQPLEEMGRIAVSLLMRLIDKQRVEALRVELATRLVVRDSTAPPRR